MDKTHYYLKFMPPRPTFAEDMTDEERELMMEHSKYVRQFFNTGKVLLYGAVMVPHGAFAVVVLQMADAAEVREFAEDDPIMVAGVATYEFYPMRVTGAQGSTH